MPSFLLGISILIISLSNTLQKIDIFSLEEKSHLIKVFLHADIFGVKSLPAIGTLDFLFALASFVLVFLWAGRLFLLLVLLFWLRSIKLILLILLLSFTLRIFGPRSKQCLIFGGSDDPHLHKLVMLVYEGLNEGIFQFGVVSFLVWNVETKNK